MTPRALTLLKAVFRVRRLVEHEVSSADLAILVRLAYAGRLSATLKRGQLCFTPRVLSFAKRAA